MKEGIGLFTEKAIFNLLKIENKGSFNRLISFDNHFVICYIVLQADN